MLLQKEVVEMMATTFLGDGRNRRDPLANPLYADLKGLPPIYIQVGADETLLDDSRRLAERAGKAGVDVRLDVFPEMQHVFHLPQDMHPTRTTQSTSWPSGCGRSCASPEAYARSAVRRAFTVTMGHAPGWRGGVKQDDSSQESNSGHVRQMAYMHGRQGAPQG